LERFRLGVADPAGLCCTSPAYGGVRGGHGPGAIALGALAATAALAVFCFVKVGGLAAARPATDKKRP